MNLNEEEIDLIQTLLTKEKGFLLEDLESGEMEQSEYDDKLTIVQKLLEKLNLEEIK